MVIQNIFDGAVFGSILVLGAVGLTLIYGIRRFPNFAHGDLMALGAYVAFAFHGALVATLVLPLDQLYISLFLAAALSAVVISLTVVLLEAGIFRRFSGESLIRPLIASIGLAFVIQNVIRIIWGTSDRTYGFPAQTAQVFLGIRVTDNDIVILTTALALVVTIHVLLKYTTLGKAMRATADNRELAKVTGINVQRIIYATWVMSGSLAAVGGVLLGLQTILRPLMGFTILLPIFAAVILGGIGSPYGAMLGGLVIGISQEVSVPVLIFLSDVTVPMSANIIALTILAGLALGGGCLIQRRLGPRRIARPLVAVGTVFGVIAVILSLAVIVTGLPPDTPIRVFFELGLQKPVAFKPAVPFIILVITLLILPNGIAGLADNPKFKEFVKQFTGRLRGFFGTLRGLLPSRPGGS